MKWVTMLLIVCCLQSNAGVCAQGITLAFDKAPLPEIFREVTRQSGVLFLYEDDLLKGTAPVTLHVSGAELEEVMDKCLAGQPLAYKVVNKTVVVSRKINLPASRADTVHTLQGIATIEGKPVMGVSVTVLHTNQGVVTESNGHFSLYNVNEHAILSFSYVGYRTVTVAVDGRSFLSVDLTEAAGRLDETVVIGYGTTTRRLNTGSVAKVSGEEIARQPVTNVLQALEGRVSGLNIVQNTGLPGGDFKIQLRGQNSIRPEGNDLLFIVDGVPFPTTSMNGNVTSASGSISPLSSINPQDISSIEVLKDADATAIYGSRGANGVILITTKKGQKGNPSINFNFSKGFGKVANRLHLLNTPEYLEVRREAFANDHATPIPNYDYDVLDWDSTRSVDWQGRLIGHTAHQTNAGLSFSGGSENTQFLLGTNYSRETTVFPGDFHDDKKSVLLNLTHKAFDNRLEISVNVNYLQESNNLLRTDLTGTAVSLSPNTPELFDAQQNKPLWPAGVYDNPYAIILRTYRFNSDNLIANTTLKYNIGNDFKFSVNLGYNKMTSDELQKVPIASFDALQNPGLTGAATSSNAAVRTWIAEPQIKWERKLGRNRLQAMTGLTFQETKTSGISFVGTGYASDDLLDNILAATSVRLSANRESLYRYGSSFSRLSYSFDEKYLLNVTGRTDASSRFGPGKRTGSFGAIGAAWIFSREGWMKENLSFMSFGKLRGSFGTTGNDQIGDYGYLDSWGASGYTYAGGIGLIPQNLKNDRFSWETNKKLEFALETGWLKDRLTVSLAWYRNRSSNQLIGYSLPWTTGFGVIQDNFAATVQNTGWEIEGSAILVHTASWEMTAGWNISFPQNKLVAFPGLSSSSYAYRYEVGKSLFVKKLYHSSGIDPQTGIYTFEDADKDGAISNPNDRQASKSVAAQYFGGANGHIEYKRITLDFLFQFVKQTGYNYLTAFGEPGTALNQPVRVLGRWRHPGDHAEVNKLTQDYGSDDYNAYALMNSLGDNVISDASFIRLKNIEVSYNAGAAFLKRSSIKQLEIFCRAQNLLTITHFLGMDPENQNVNRLPPLKMIAAGIQVQL